MDKTKKLLIIIILILTLTIIKQYLNAIALRGESVKRFYEGGCLLHSEFSQLFNSEYNDKEINYMRKVEFMNRYNFGINGLYSDKTKELYSYSDDVSWLLARVDFANYGDEDKVLGLLENFSNCKELHDKFQIDNSNIIFNYDAGKMIEHIRWYFYFK